MQYQLPLLFACFFVSTLSAQPAIEWQKALGGSSVELSSSIMQTSDGGYITAGSSYSNDGNVSGNHGNSDFWVVKLNSTGAIQWQKSLGGSKEDFARSVQQTSDGGYILAGHTRSNDGDVSGNDSDLGDFWVVKISNTGVLQWQKSIGGPEAEDAYSIQQTNDGGYIVAGITGSTDNHGLFDAWVVKLDNIGTVQWQKALGGTDYDYAYSIRQTSDGGYIMAGYTQSNNGDVSGNHGKADYWIVKLNASGEIQWQKTLGGTEDEYAFSIQQTSDGGFAVVGFTLSNNGEVSGNHGATDFWALKLNNSGNIQWQKTLGGSSTDNAHAIVQTNDGGYLIAGTTSSDDGDVTGHHIGSNDAWIVKLNNSGQIKSQKALGGGMVDGAFSIGQTNDGGYILAGETGSNDGDVSGFHGGFTDCWVVKLFPESVGTNNPIAPMGGLEIFPNPSNQFVFLKTPSESLSMTVLITDPLGRKISTLTIAKDERLDISTLPKGQFFFIVTTAYGQVFSNKFSKQE